MRHCLSTRCSALVALSVAALVLAPAPASGQAGPRIRDLIVEANAVPVRLVGYGLVTGLDGTGDRGTGGRAGGMTPQSIANMLQRFDVEVPAEYLRSQNVAAVTVTAEVSPFLRAGGRFDVHVASLGDARSLKGGVLWMTPLVAEAGADPVATAQGPLLLAPAPASRRTARVGEGTARVVAGGVIEQDLPRPTSAYGDTLRLVLREPDLATAVAIAAAVTGAHGSGSAIVEDPGAVRLQLPARPAGGADTGTAARLAAIGALTVALEAPARIVIDARSGAVIAGGDLPVGDAAITHHGFALTVGATTNGRTAPGDSSGTLVELERGVPVQRVVAALQQLQAAPADVSAVLEALRAAGAITATVVVR